MFELTPALTSELSIRSGTIIDIEPEGLILVRPTASDSLVRAYFLRTTQAAPPRLQTGDKVLFAVDADEGCGFVLGLVESYAAPAETSSVAPSRTVELSLSESADKVRLNGKKIYIEAGEEIQLTCGGGTILIDRRGKIVVRGTEVVSRARGKNKIKGASVDIN
jgi:hypothetical protein